MSIIEIKDFVAKRLNSNESVDFLLLARAAFCIFILICFSAVWFIKPLRKLNTNLGTSSIPPCDHIFLRCDIIKAKVKFKWRTKKKNVCELPSAPSCTVSDSLLGKGESSLGSSVNWTESASSSISE